MSSAFYLTAAGVLAAIEASILTWLLTDVSIFDIGLTWLACGSAAMMISSIVKDLKQEEIDR